MAEQEQRPFDEEGWRRICERINREIAASKAAINRNRQWYKLTTKASGQIWDNLQKLLKTASDQTLIDMYWEIPKLDKHNTNFFVLKVTGALDTAIYEQLHKRGYECAYDPVKQTHSRIWTKRKPRPRAKRGAHDNRA